ncbi:hypothetical protein [Archangium sp.]|uniref:hypothetical protein n=1 Tax=Archangium sp. TaxID=1872627 RepID=UPI002D7431BA|nr:hypothetical protein [Archangium sp.]HYO54467.1 hypothetical protein [Archangium sp.]
MLEKSSAGRPSLLDVLLQIRDDILRGRIEMHLGETNIHRLVGFVDGYRACLVDHDTDDMDFARFCEWLKSVKEEFPVEGWAAKYLRDCKGDHLAAIKKFLDFVAEFVEVEGKTSGQEA